MKDMPGWPRGMPEPMAASYVGLSVSTLRAERAAGRFPAQTPLTAGRYVCLKDHLDEYLDKKAGIVPEVNEWDIALPPMSGGEYNRAIASGPRAKTR